MVLLIGLKSVPIECGEKPTRVTRMPVPEDVYQTLHEGPKECSNALLPHLNGLFEMKRRLGLEENDLTKESWPHFWPVSFLSHISTSWEVLGRPEGLESLSSILASSCKTYNSTDDLIMIWTAPVQISDPLLCRFADLSEALDLIPKPHALRELVICLNPHVNSLRSLSGARLLSYDSELRLPWLRKSLRF